MKWSTLFKVNTEIKPLITGEIPTEDNTKLILVEEEPPVILFKEKYFFFTTKQYKKNKEKIMALTKGKKFDGIEDSSIMKLRYDLIPPEILEKLAEIYTYGAGKYGENQWQHLPNAHKRYFGALMRHLMAFRKGETIDAESKLSHLAHAFWNVGALLWLETQNKK